MRVDSESIMSITMMGNEGPPPAGELTELRLCANEWSYWLVLVYREVESGDIQLFYPYPTVRRGTRGFARRLAELRAKGRRWSKMTRTPYREDDLWPGDEL